MGEIDKNGVWHCTVPGEIISIGRGVRERGHCFVNEELEVLFHAAKYALADADIFDDLAVDLDISDDEMMKLREKLYNYLRG
jgi:hypothetical protein